MRKANIVVSALCVLLGAYVISVAKGFPENLSAVDPGPAYFPTLMAGMVILLSLILGGLAVSGKGKDAGEQLDFHAGSRRAAAGVILFFLYCLLFKKLGFIIDSIWFCIASMVLLQNRKYQVVIITSIAVSVVIYFVFASMLGAKLPAGLLKGIL